MISSGSQPGFFIVSALPTVFPLHGENTDRPVSLHGASQARTAGVSCFKDSEFCPNAPMKGTSGRDVGVGSGHSYGEKHGEYFHVLPESPLKF